MDSADGKWADLSSADLQAADFLKFLRDQYGVDKELLHVYADDFLCLLLEKCGFSKTATVFNALPKWYA